MSVILDIQPQESRRVASFLINHQDQLRSILFTGAAGSEGTSTVVLAVAQTIASSCDQSVLVIDTCLHAPAIHAMTGTNLAPGLQDWNGSDIPNYQAVAGSERLNVLTIGREPASKTLEHSQRMSQLANRTRQEFGFVLWDTAPLSRFPDALLIAPHVDGVVAVVEADHTRIDHLRFLRDQMDSVNGKILGAILNRTGRYWPWPKEKLRGRKGTTT